MIYCVIVCYIACIYINILCLASKNEEIMIISRFIKSVFI